MIPFIANTNSKWTYGLKALGLLLLSVFLTQILWSNVSFTELAQISQPITSFAYLQLGATSFTTIALGHSMFILSLFLFGSKQEFVMKQLIAFGIAHVITLWLGAFHVLNISGYIIQALVLLTTIYIAGENIFAFKLKKPRITAVFICGLIHGLGMSASVHEAGLPKSFYTKSLFMYNVGIELAIACFAIPAFLLLVKFAAGKPYSKTFFNIISVGLVLAAAYFTTQQLFLSN